MLYSELFVWWAISISWSAVFLVAVSLYIYANRKKSATNGLQDRRGIRKITDFVFVLVLLSLLALYLVSIDIGSYVLFAAGNIVVEAVLIAYTIKNRTRK